MKSMRAGKLGDGRRGAALIVALLVVLMVGVLSMSYLQMSLSKNREQQGAADAKRAFYMAESGLSEAYSGLLAGKSGNVGSDIVPARFGNGLFWVKAEQLGNAHTCLTSTGMCGTGRACVSIVVRNQNQSVASNGVFSDQNVSIQVGSLIDSYDSRLGSYASQVGGGGGLIGGLLGELGGTSTAINAARVGSNGNILVQGTTVRGPGAIIRGDARPGPTGVVVRGTGATITGSTSPTTEPLPLPALQIPAITQTGSLAVTKASPALVLPTGRVGLTSLSVSATGAAVITGPTVLVVDQLVLATGAHLSIDTTNGPVKIYVRDWLRCDPGSTITRTDTAPTKCALLCAASTPADRDGDGIVDPPVTLGSTSDFHGFVYAPGASFTLPNSFHMYGAIVSSALTVAGGGQVHFDRAFLDESGEGGAMPSELCWRLVQLPPARIVDQRLDPMTYLKLQGVVPPESKDAHYDIGVTPPTLITRIWKTVNLQP
jgi:Tfp pilus assembly protein PilX